MEIKVKKSEIPTNYFCNLCNKFYASASSLCNHNKKFHKIETNNNTSNLPQNNLFLPQDTSINHNKKNKLECVYCNKILSRYDNLKRHEKICKNKNNIIDENTLLKNEINDLKDKINILLKSNKIHPKKLQKINTQNNINNNINNNIQNNNIQNNINLTYVKFGNEKLSEILTKKEMNKILSQLRLSVEESIKLVHFNDKRPEYKNVFITNMKDNLAYIFNGDKFEVKSKDYVLSDLLNNHLGNIESFIEENDIEENQRNKHLFKFIKEINGEDINADVQNYKKYKLDKIKQFVYNNSDKSLLKNLNKLELTELTDDN